MALPELRHIVVAYLLVVMKPLAWDVLALPLQSDLWRSGSLHISHRVLKLTPPILAMIGSYHPFQQ